MNKRRKFIGSFLGSRGMKIECQLQMEWISTHSVRFLLITRETSKKSTKSPSASSRLSLFGITHDDELMSALSIGSFLGVDVPCP